jgi:hypothetical protein
MPKKKTKTNKATKLKGISKNPQPHKAAKQRVNPGRAKKAVRFVANAILPCDVKNLIANRPDTLLLEKHLEAIEEHRQKYQHRLDQAKAKLAKGDASEKHAMPAHRAKITEAIGDRETTLAVIQSYVKSVVGHDYELVRGFSAGTGIDQIWYSKTKDEFLLVEAKGPGAGLSTDAAKGNQMSKQWIRASLAEEINSSHTSPADKANARRMRHAMDTQPPPTVIGAVFMAKPGGGAERVTTVPDNGIYHGT